MGSDETTYLYEVMEDYHSAGSVQEKHDIIRAFRSAIWSSPNKRRVYTKVIRFKVNKQRLDSELGQIFDLWSEVEYKGCKSITGETDYASLIRQKINNLYTRYCDKEVILRPEYLNLLKTPKQLYYLWLAGEPTDADEITALIDDAIARSIVVKEQLQKEKMALTWEEFKKVIETCFDRIFESSCLIDDYESDSAGLNNLDCITEDNFYIRYFCRSLEGLIQNFQKDYYKVRRGNKIRYLRCQECKTLSERRNNRQKYCLSCSALLRKRYKANMEKERRARQRYCSGLPAKTDSQPDHGHTELYKKLS